MFYEFLKNKRVAFIGPAPYLQHTNNARYIDGYDVIIRPACGYRVPDKFKEDYGVKINIWCANFTSFIFDRYINEDIICQLSKRGLKWFCLSHENIKKEYLSQLKSYSKKYNISIHIVEENIIKKLTKKIFVNVKKIKKITTGSICIYDILQSDLKELYVSGITFYKCWPKNRRKMYYSGYYKEGTGYSYSSRALMGHDTKRELLFFKKMCNTDKRIKCDDILLNILNS
jgi:hypothetical protein